MNSPVPCPGMTAFVHVMSTPLVTTHALDASTIGNSAAPDSD